MRNRLVHPLVTLALLLVGVGAALGQAYDDADAQLRIKQAASAASAAQHEVDGLRAALEGERRRVIASDAERDLNREAIETLQRTLREAEAQLRERQAAVAAAQEARLRGQAAQPRAPMAQPVAQDDALAAELQLGLSLSDRRHLQVALTALGFGTGDSDGVLGARSREAIAAWQKAHGQPATGYVNGAQRQALFKEGAAAIQKYDEEQARLEAAARDRERAATSAPAPAVPSQVVPDVRSIVGTWIGVIEGCCSDSTERRLRIRVEGGRHVCLWAVSTHKGIDSPCIVSASEIRLTTTAFSAVVLTRSGNNASGSFTLKNGRQFKISMTKAE